MTDFDDINEVNSASHLDDKNNIHHIPITDVYYALGFFIWCVCNCPKSFGTVVTLCVFYFIKEYVNNCNFLYFIS